MARGTAEAMARGGMYDQLGGGFARYSVDANWVVPHFEKMLYDNALLLRVYAHLWRADRRRARPPGGPARPPTSCCATCSRTRGRSRRALDADTVGRRPPRGPDLRLVARPARRGARRRRRGARGRAARRHPRGNLRARHLDPAAAHRPRRPAGGRTPGQRLLAARGARPQPSRDDKVVTSWNGLAIAALADAGVLLHRPDLVGAAERAAAYVLETHDVSGPTTAPPTGCCAAPREPARSAPPRPFSTTTATSPRGCSPSTRRREMPAGGRLRHPCSTGRLLASSTPTARSTTPPPTPPRSSPGPPAAPTTPSPAAPQPSPAPCSARRPHRLTPPRGGGRRRPRRLRLGRRAGPAVRRVDARGRRGRAAGPLQVAVVGEGPGAQALLEVARASTSPASFSCTGCRTHRAALLADRPLVDGAPAAYVCRGFVCDRPVTGVAELTSALTQR